MANATTRALKSDAGHQANKWKQLRWLHGVSPAVTEERKMTTSVSGLFLVRFKKAEFLIRKISTVPFARKGLGAHIANVEEESFITLPQ